ncbi:MAG: response regulator [Chloroflexi bacterium]|nr:response regulator [Chloroflexota bacterium]
MGMTDALLVVDDDPAIRDLLELVLTAEGYTVALAASGVEALRQIGPVSPALVLLDDAMPGLTGCEVVRTLRAQGWAVPILVLSAGDDSACAAAASGATAFLAKPFDLDELLRTVARLAVPPGLKVVVTKALAGGQFDVAMAAG